MTLGIKDNLAVPKIQLLQDQIPEAHNCLSFSMEKRDNTIDIQCRQG